MSEEFHDFDPFAADDTDIFDDDDEYEWGPEDMDNPEIEKASRRYQGILSIFYRQQQPLTYAEIYRHYTQTMGGYRSFTSFGKSLAGPKIPESAKHGLAEDIAVINAILGEVIVPDSNNVNGEEPRFRLRPADNPALSFDAYESVWVHLALTLLEGNFTQIESHIRSQSEALDGTELSLQSRTQIPKFTQELFRAIARRQFLDFEYQDREGRVTQRRLQPMLMMLSRGFFYVRGFDEATESFRTFKLQRLSNLRISKETQAFEPQQEALTDSSLERRLPRILFAADPQKAVEALTQSSLVCEFSDLPTKGHNYMTEEQLEGIPEGWNIYAANTPDFYTWSRLSKEFLTHLIVLDPPELVTDVTAALGNLNQLELIPGPFETGSLKFDDTEKRRSPVAADNQMVETARFLAVMTFILREAQNGLEPTVAQVATHFGLGIDQVKQIIWNYNFVDSAANNLKTDYSSFLPMIRKDGTIEVNGSTSWVMPPSFSSDEALSLLLGLEVAGYLAPSSHAAISTARLKVASWLGQNHGLTPPELVTNAIPAKVQNHLEALNRAIAAKSVVTFDYTNASWETARQTVAPVSILTDRHLVYLVGVNLNKNKWHHYRLDRLDHLELTDTAIPQKLPNRIGYKYQTIDLELDNAAKSYVDTILHTEVLEQLEDRYTVRLKVKDPAWLQRVIQILGSQLISIHGGEKHAAVVREVVATSQRALAQYRRTGSPGLPTPR